MNGFAKARFAVLAAAAATLAGQASPASALTASGLRGVPAATSAGLVKVHDRWSDDDEGDRHWRRHHRDDGVEAPFTRVETGHRVVVDAPFAHIAVGRNGRHIVAPFVDLWLPR